MLQLKNIHLHNIVMYDDASFSFEPGISVIYGLNKDSDSLSARSNGAGKSKIFCALAEVLFDINPVISGRQAIKDDYYRSGARVDVDFNDYRLTKEKRGASLKYNLSKFTGKGYESLKSREVDEVLPEIFPLSSDEFFNLYYIDSSRSSEVQLGTHTTRFRLFSSFFRLGAYDEVLLRVKDQLKSLRQTEAKYKEVDSQLSNFESSDFDSNQAVEIKQKIKNLSKRVQSLSDKRQEAQYIVDVVSQYKNAKPLIEKAKSLGFTVSLDEEENLAQLQEFAESKKQLIKQKKDIQSKLSGSSYTIDDWNLAANVDKIISQHGFNWEDLLALGSLQSFAKKLKAQLSELKQEIQECKAAVSEKVVSTEKYDTVKQEYIRNKTIYEEKLQEWENFDSTFNHESTCPVCRTNLSEKSLNTIRRVLKNEVKEAHNTLQLSKDALTIAKKASAYKKWLTEKNHISDEIKQVSDEYASLRDKINTLDKVKQKCNDTDVAYLSSLVGKPKPEIEITNLYDEITDKLAKIKESIATLELLNNFYLPHIKSYKELVDSVSFDIQEVKQGLAKIDSKLLSYNEQLSSLNRSYGAMKSKKEQFTLLRDRLTVLEEELADKPLLKILESAYGSKGLKNVEITNNALSVEKNLNLYAPLLFAEDVKFIVDVGDNQLNIQISRVINEEVRTVDVRRLSGAERRQFILLFPLAVIPLIPSCYRLDTIILDEPTANMDDAAVDMFCSNYLPKLKELISKVIVISPNELPMDTSNASIYTVKREEGKATIERTNNV